MKNGKISSTILLKSLFKLFYTEKSKVAEQCKRISSSLTDVMGFENKVSLMSEINYSDDEDVIEIIEQAIKEASKNGYFCDENEDKSNILEKIIYGNYFLDNFVTNEELEDKNNIKTLLKYNNCYLIGLTNRIKFDEKVIESVCELYEENNFSLDEINDSLEFFEELSQDIEKYKPSYDGMVMITKKINGKSLK